MDDPYDLQRFADAQTPIYGRVVTELRSGHKQSHWMWFVFPQLAGLGRSAMAQRFAIASLDEARAYLRHPLLGPRYRECVALVLDVAGRAAHAIFGAPDDLKFHSSLTLFAAAAPQEALFQRALDKYFAGKADAATLANLAQAPAAPR